MIDNDPNSPKDNAILVAITIITKLTITVKIIKVNEKVLSNEKPE